MLPSAPSSLTRPSTGSTHGGVIQVASLAAYQPTPYFAVYGATKAFVLSFGEALWAEYRERGVRVLTVSPGATQTQFFARAGEAAGGDGDEDSSADSRLSSSELMPSSSYAGPAALERMVPIPSV